MIICQTLITDQYVSMCTYRRGGGGRACDSNGHIGTRRCTRHHGLQRYTALSCLLCCLVQCCVVQCCVVLACLVRPCVISCRFRLFNVMSYRPILSCLGFTTQILPSLFLHFTYILCFTTSSYYQSKCLMSHHYVMHSAHLSNFVTSPCLNTHQLRVTRRASRPSSQTSRAKASPQKHSKELSFKYVLCVCMRVCVCVCVCVSECVCVCGLLQVRTVHFILFLSFCSFIFSLQIVSVFSLSFFLIFSILFSPLF